MAQNIATIKPLFLTEEEAIAMLDMCLMSNMETDPVKECAMLKMSDLVRRYIQEEEPAAEAQATESALQPDAEPIPVATLLQCLSEPPVSERSFDVKMNHHTGRVYFGRRLRRYSALAYTD